MGPRIAGAQTPNLEAEPPKVVDPVTRADAEAHAGRALRPALEAAGFRADGAHFVRRVDGVDHVVELQHSVYGARVTVNLGLDLAFLRPLSRWLPRPALGPKAHDCARWIRVGAAASGPDLWWSYEEQLATEELVAKVVCEGLPWLDREGTAAAFSAHALRGLERSKNRAQPDGGYLELRLLAAVFAWTGDFEAAREVAQTARAQWPRERERLVMARGIYRRRASSRRLAPVPDLQGELERLSAPTTGGRILRRAGAKVPAAASDPGPR